MNLTILSGYIATEELKLQQTESGKTFLRFTVAISNGKDKDGNPYEADFMPCEAWELRALHIAEYYSKGKGIEIIGKLKQDRWVDKDGNKRSKHKVLVDVVEFPKSNRPAIGKATEPHSFEPGGADNDTIDGDDFPF